MAFTFTFQDVKFVSHFKKLLADRGIWRKEAANPRTYILLSPQPPLLVARQLVGSPSDRKNLLDHAGT